MSNWVPRRRKPEGKEATAGKWGTISQCLGGDIVCAQSCDGKRFAWLEIAWCYGGRDQDAMAHVFNPERGCIDLRAPFLRQIKGWQRCRFMGVRSK